MTYWPNPRVWTPDPGAEFQCWRGLYGHQNYAFRYFPTGGSREDNFWIYGLSLHIWPCLWLPRGGETIYFKILILTIQMFYTKNGNNSPCSFQEVKKVKLLTHDDRRRPDSYSSPDWLIVIFTFNIDLRRNRMSKDINFFRFLAVFDEQDPLSF